jgi:thiol-disulfide isomerase/thioredoxin
MHRFIPLPDNKFFVGVCRHAFPIEADFCHACDVMAPAFEGDNKLKKRNGLVPVDVAVALAVEMEAVMNGRVFAGYRPKQVEFEIPQITDAEKNDAAEPVPASVKEYRALLNKLGEPGSKVKIPNIGLMVGTLSGKQALFDYATRRQSISDRVFEIARHGKGLDTTWDWNHEGKDQENPDPTELLVDYRNRYPFELPEEWVIRNGSEDKYNYFFKLNAAGEEDAEKASAEKDDVDPVSDSRTALMERLKGNK